MEKEFEFIPIDYDSIDIGDKSFIRIFGRDNHGKRICLIDSCDSFFYVIPKKGKEKYISDKAKKLELVNANRRVTVPKTEIIIKRFLGREYKVVKIYSSNHKDIPVIKDIVKEWPETEKKLEVDINFITRYILERDVKPLIWQKVRGEEAPLEKYGLDKCNCTVFTVSKIEESEQQHDFKPKILAFDIEADEFEVGKGEIILVSIVSNTGMKKVITSKKFRGAEKEVEFVENEKELLKKFREIVKKEEADFLVGYFSDGFDLPYIRARADKYKIKMDIGWSNSNINFIRGVISSAKVNGLVHIDLFKFVESIIAPSLHTETLSLNDVAYELIGERKLDINIKKATKTSNSDEIKKFIAYNLQDSILAEKLFQKLWPTISEITKIVALPVFNSTRSGYSQLVEHYLMLNASRFNEMIPNRPTRDKIIERRMHTYAGGFVLQPQFALYKNIVVFDFLSFWPNIISTFNISPETLQSTSREAYATPEVEFDGKKRKFYFNKKIKALIPTVLTELLEKRIKIKHELKKYSTPILEARAHAYKTLANATYGYFGFFGARWYCLECSASSTGFGKFFIQKVIERIKKAGFKVIYGDTDSVMFELGDKTEKNALELLEEINKELPGRLELELEDIYRRGLFVAKKTVKVGAKKKYALLAKDGSIKIRGFETVRRDWCSLAKEVQHQVLKTILMEGKPDNSIKYIQNIIEQIKKKKIPNEKLIIRTQLKKEIESYESITPHVVIAKRMHERNIPVGAGSLIEFIIAEQKTKNKAKEKAVGLIRERARLPDEVKEGEYDVNYYIERQIIPAVENILDIFGITRKEIIEGKKQKKLGDF